MADPHRIGERDGARSGVEVRGQRLLVTRHDLVVVVDVDAVQKRQPPLVVRQPRRGGDHRVDDRLRLRIGFLAFVVGVNLQALAAVRVELQKLDDAGAMHAGGRHRGRQVVVFVDAGRDVVVAGFILGQAHDVRQLIDLKRARHRVTGGALLDPHHERLFGVLVRISLIFCRISRVVLPQDVEVLAVGQRDDFRRLAVVGLKAPRRGLVTVRIERLAHHRDRGGVEPRDLQPLGWCARRSAAGGAGATSAR